jgi:DNA-binding transcriptional MerR regulator
MRIEWIGKLQELGFSLQEVSDFLRDLHSYETGPDTMGRLREFYQQKVEDTRAGIERLKTLQEGLLESISFLDDCQSCTSDADTSTCVSCHEAKTRHLPDMVAAIHSTPTSTAR